VPDLQEAPGVRRMAGDNSRSKPVTLNRAIQRLMVLDAIVEHPDLVWLGTADEKATHLLALTRIVQADLPHVSVGEGEARTVRYFPDRLPIGIHLAGRAVVVVTEPWLDEFRVFLERHAALLRVLRAGSSRTVSLRRLRRAVVTKNSISARPPCKR
jgi:hypothetical protein